VLRLLPPRLRASLWSRCYHPTGEHFHGLFASALLHFAPNVRMQLVPGDVISDSIAFTGLYDLSFSRHVSAVARKGGVLIDVGANLGYFSLLWAAARPDNHVVAFEPSPRNIELLKANVFRNGFADRIDIRTQAVGSASGEMEFDTGPEEQTGWGGLSLKKTQQSIRVPVVRLDEALTETDEIAMLKIDIEGADTWAILGAERLLRERRIKNIWWEQNTQRMRQLEIPAAKSVEFLKGLGYEPTPNGHLDANTINWFATLR
jgi:FkbM family methyltransferase